MVRRRESDRSNAPGARSGAVGGQRGSPAAAHARRRGSGRNDAQQAGQPSERPVRSENSIRPATKRGRGRSEMPGAVQDGPGSARGDGRAGANARRRGATDAPAAARPEEATRRVVPDHVRERFVQVGKHYYFADGTRAFSDRGGRLTTPSENTEVVRSLVAIALARGWNEISVRGTDRFRKDAWFAARQAGLEVRGYRPTEFEQAHLIRTLGRQQGRSTAAPSMEPGIPEGRSRSTAEDRSAVAQERSRGEERLLVGKLVDHGRATYHHDPRAPMSYFVRIETARGDRTVWGVDLERALKDSLTRPEIGDDIGLRTVRQDAVKVRSAQRDAEGRLIAERELQTHRNQWIVEKHGFFESRAEAARTLRDVTIDAKQAVKRHPELVGTYHQVRAAQLAAKELRDPEDRQRFVAQVRSALADAVARGEPLPPVRLRERAAERGPVRSRGTRDRQSPAVRE